MCSYEETFARSEDTDAILVVEGKKLHVNKGLLSIHSPYFKTLFNSDFKEKSMEEIPIEDVNFYDFATVLSLVQPNPLHIYKRSIENLFKVADRFILNGPKLQLERFVQTSTEFSNFERIVIADKCKLNNVRNAIIWSFYKKEDFFDFYNKTEKLSADTKAKLFDKYFSMYSCVHGE